ncbi:MAG TPA: DUF3052 domain-containing protein [Candidatus Kapabacteria bacterium]|nr:DUF3052 domain-containing protein [Candidatus Kapabacteria bacterium]
MPAGYSGTPLVKKLGIKENTSMKLVNEPANYLKLLGKIPSGIIFIQNDRESADFIHLFVIQASVLKKQLLALKKQLKKDGMLWISWPKKSAKVATDIDENIIRDTGLATGLVDVKVCAVDETWSGLKFVYRLKDR